MMEGGLSSADAPANRGDLLLWSAGDHALESSQVPWVPAKQVHSHPLGD